MFDPDDIPQPDETLTYEGEMLRRLFFHLTMAAALVRSEPESAGLPKAVLYAEEALSLLLKVRRTPLAHERYPATPCGVITLLDPRDG